MTEPERYNGTFDVAHHHLAEDGIRRMLMRIGEDPGREGLRETPARVVRAFVEMTEGYSQDPGEILTTTFEATAYDEMILLKGIRFFSLCEHHLLPFSGVATVGYIPEARVVGLSKLARLVDCFAKRLQLQERLTLEIAESIMQVLAPKGAGCVIRANHSCMGCRGIKKPDAEMVTSAMLGLLRDDEKARGEFLRLME
jgi:GTP cyclohydrolase I